MLCSVDVAVFIFGSNKKLYEYSSCDMRDLITRYTYVRMPEIPFQPINLLTIDHSMVDRMNIRALRISMAAPTTTTMMMRTERPLKPTG